MLVYDCSPGRTVLAECTVELDGGAVRLVAKDNGRVVNLAVRTAISVPCAPIPCPACWKPIPSAGSICSP